MSRVSHLLFFLISHVLLLSLAQGEETKPKPECEPLSCGVLGHIRFPFSNETYPDCGLLTVEGCNEQVQTIQLDKDWPRLYITGISQDNTLELRDELGSSESSNSHSCNDSLKNLTLSSPFISFELSFNQTLFKCPRYTIPEDFVSLCNDSQHSIIYYNGTSHNISDISSKLSPGCSNIQFRKNKNQKGIDFANLFTGSFQLQVNVTKECRECNGRRGQCQIDDNGKFQCLNATKGDGQLGSKLGRGLAIGTSATVVVILTIILFVMKKSSSDNCIVFWKKKTESYQNIEAFLRNYGSLAPKRYNYSDIKKMTNSFREKLGQGGYGGVYRGRLQDGRTVAVKVLKEAQGNGEEFINEVATISRTSHVNIVALLGFCFEGHKRALIYEFVPNGSLEKFIYRKNLSEPNQKLKWETVYQIAVGIAQGLEYLHRGCSTRILHFDIKPHNILLDEDFCPKISDFGLAKICLKKESTVSMTGARGTIGYIAPELCCRNFGRVSHKSDVYSYGMMVLEMVGGRKNIDVGVDHSSEIYFPHWIYNRLEVDERLVPQGTSNEEEKECARKMVIVSLWCIQTNPSDRPTMSRVVDMLKGSIGSLQIPPKPFLSSPRSPPRDYSSTTLVS